MERRGRITDVCLTGAKVVSSVKVTSSQLTSLDGSDWSEHRTICCLISRRSLAFAWFPHVLDCKFHTDSSRLNGFRHFKPPCLRVSGSAPERHLQGSGWSFGAT
eukprot:2229615-Amphidinium_carterae.2